ncbi:MAG: glycosyltransferase family 2 protein [Caldilineales bacterium]|nr:glycosyltransferase family 2 protein [Caldilineales bacterium]
MTRLLSGLTFIALLLFSIRRLVFTLAALLSPPLKSATDSAESPPHFYKLLILIPCRNDGRQLPGIVQSLISNGYPLECLRIILIDDGSTDGSAQTAADIARANEHVRAISLPQNAGKAAALNAGLAHEPWGDLVVVYDADHRPQSGGLSMLASAFDDPYVGAVSGRTAARNALKSPSTYYSAVERLVHQRITMVAKDRLNLAPAILGSHCAYRRALLDELGGFPAGAFLEDSELTIRIAAAGYRTRYLESIPAWDETPETLSGYWKQHVRWGRGFQDVAIKQRTITLEQKLPPLLRLELFAFSLGYLDRLALLAGLVFTAADALLNTRFHFPKRYLIAVAALPYLQVVVALVRTRAGIGWWLRLPYLFLLFPVDVAASLWAALTTILNRPRQWQQTERSTQLEQPFHLEPFPHADAA